MRLFLDANVLFSVAHGPGGAAARLVEFSQAGACELVTSTFAVTEATRNLRAKAPSASKTWDRLATLVAVVPEADPRLAEKAGATLQAKDLPILAAALACRAAVLVTGDRRHFGPLYGRAFGGTVVLAPRDALAWVVASILG